MALRVLLADESPSIKKVMQISLQDFGVELKNVQLGLDVFQVAEQFQPDIVFCDVLLQKKSGYDVCIELKNHKSTAHIPIVLMWSGFLELDEEKFKECKADAQLEKPFDANSLRDVVKRLVKKTESHQMADFLQFPEVTMMHTKVGKASREESTKVGQPTPPIPPTTPDSEVARGAWNMESFDDISESPIHHDIPIYEIETNIQSPDEDIDGFSQKPLQPIRETPPSIQGGQPPQVAKPVVKPMVPRVAPVTSDLGRQNRNQRGQSHGNIEIPEIDTSKEDELSHSELLANVSMNPNEFDQFNMQGPPKVKRQEPVVEHNKHAEPVLRMDQAPQLTQEQLELIIHAQSKEVIERVVWKLVPEIAQRMIQEEIHRLMDESKL